MVDVRFQSDHFCSRNGGIDHLAFLSCVQADAAKAGAAALDVVDDSLANLLFLIGDDEEGFVALHTFNHKVDDFALDGDEQDGVDGQTYLVEGDKGGERDGRIDNHDQRA